MFLTSGTEIRLLIASLALPPISLLCEVSLILATWRSFERKIDMERQIIEKIIKKLGPESEISLPQISKAKYWVTLVPKNAPRDPPALMIPNNLFPSSLLKKLIKVAQKIETTNKE